MQSIRITRITQVLLGKKIKEKLLQRIDALPSDLYYSFILKLSLDFCFHFPFYLVT